MAQCPCLICRSSTVRAESSARRNPQPTSTESIAAERFVCAACLPLRATIPIQCGAPAWGQASMHAKPEPGTPAQEPAAVPQSQLRRPKRSRGLVPISIEAAACVADAPAINLTIALYTNALMRAAENISRTVASCAGLPASIPKGRLGTVAMADIPREAVTMKRWGPGRLYVGW